MQNKKFGALSSSVNPEQLSATVSGAILTVSSLIIFFAHQVLGVTLIPDQISTFAQQAGVSIGFVWMCWGLFRKLIVSVQQARAKYRSPSVE